MASVSRYLHLRDQSRPSASTSCESLERSRTSSQTLNDADTRQEEYHIPYIRLILKGHFTHGERKSYLLSKSWDRDSPDNLTWSPRIDGRVELGQFVAYWTACVISALNPNPPALVGRTYNSHTPCCLPCGCADIRYDNLKLRDHELEKIGLYSLSYLNPFLHQSFHPASRTFLSRMNPRSSAASTLLVSS